jgi:hypothetical protein
MRFAALSPSYVPALEAKHATIPPLRLMRSPVKWVERSKTRTRTDGQRPETALRRPAIQCSGGIALQLPRPNTWPLNIQRLGRFRPYCLLRSFRPAVWRVCHVPRTHFSSADRCERTACDCSAIARPGTTLFPRPAVLRLWPTRETLAQRHARWPRRISLRDGAQRVRAYMATGALHTFARTRQRRRGCAQ